MLIHTFFADINISIVIIIIVKFFLWQKLLKKRHYLLKDNIAKHRLFIYHSNFVQKKNANQSQLVFF